MNMGKYNYDKSSVQKRLWKKTCEFVLDSMKGFTKEKIAKYFFDLGRSSTEVYPLDGTSIIKWQTGVPKENGHYLITLRYWRGMNAKTGKKEYAEAVTKDIWNGFWYDFCDTEKYEILAWCKLSDVEPYKE